MKKPMAVAQRSEAAVAKRPEPVRIQLDRADYYELKSLALDREMKRQALLSAKAAFESAQVALSEKAIGHGVQVGQPYAFDDATCSLVVGEAGSEPSA